MTRNHQLERPALRAAFLCAKSQIFKLTRVSSVTIRFASKATVGNHAYSIVPDGYLALR